MSSSHQGDLAAASVDEVVAAQQLLARYHHVVDDRAFDRLPSVLTSAAVLVVGDRPPLEGIAAIRAALEAADPPDHAVLNTVVERADDGGLRCRSRYLTVAGDGAVGVGEYRDTVVVTSDGLRLARREARRR